MLIRLETPSDIDAITDVTIAAFNTLAISEHTEQFIIHALRKANALELSLVAEIDGKVVGHIAASKVTISDGSQNWYGLGPLSVLPELHRQGIGSALMREIVAQLKARGAEGCVLVGEPDYYVKFGFKSLPELTYEGVPQQYVLSLRFSENSAHGAATFHKAFSATE